MTEGIIQEVFKKYESKPFAGYAELQQELIEKIKQEFQAYHYNESGLSFHEIRKILIGDNQE